MPKPFVQVYRLLQTFVQVKNFTQDFQQHFEKEKKIVPLKQHHVLFFVIMQIISTNIFISLQFVYPKFCSLKTGLVCQI